MRLFSLGFLLAMVPAVTGHAFCGFYVAGGGAELFNNATQVVLMRDGSRTVLSMQNNYQGPPSDFAMVVPVPVVLKEEHVKTLPREIFDRVDSLTAPRLVEYWEQDPCFQPPVMKMRRMAQATSASAPVLERSGARLGVTIEAKFVVGEYKILILSAKDSTGLETWLRQEKYAIPAGASKLLRPYVQAGMKFFVAKVDVSKVKFHQGTAQLSPLRFHYDHDDFSLPVRLGMMNSAGTQDLIVHILSPGHRYAVANYDNVSIPTNLDLEPEAKARFGELYAALFDETLARHPAAVVTEYAWDARNCDPCPTPPLRADELQTLGADVLYAGTRASDGEAESPTGASDGVLELRRQRQRRRAMQRRGGSGFILTRLHARYAKGSIQDDLVFRQAAPIAGGREFLVDGQELEQGAVKAPINNFQARYAIRHPWTGPITCDNPVRNRWGGPPQGGGRQVQPAKELAFAPRGGLKSANLVKRGHALPQLLDRADGAPVPEPVKEPTPAASPKQELEPSPKGKSPGPAAPAANRSSEPEVDDCSVSAVGGRRSRSAAAVLLASAWLLLRRRRGHRGAVR
ncbi:MAG: DUF2330 domain-containing protein [Myxococcales bacterium]|nr:DUF2330 domain-containing protein [Myxococcales bacterium]